MKAKSFAGWFIATTTKRLRSASGNDLTKGSHNVGFICLRCISCSILSCQARS